MVRASNNEFPSVLFEEQASAPSTPAAGNWRIYFKSDGFYLIEDDGTEHGPVDAGVDATTTKGDILVNNGTTLTRLAVGTDDHVLKADSAQTEGIKWAAESGGGGGSSATTAYKASDESVSSSTTLQNDDDLTFAIGANEIWVARYVLFVEPAADGVDLKMGFSVPASSTGWWGYQGLALGATSVSVSARVQSDDIANSQPVGTPNGGSYSMVLVNCYVDTAGTSGNVVLQWAQWSSSASAITLKTGSHLVAHQLA